jgi:prephenate dehydrogenase
MKIGIIGAGLIGGTLLRGFTGGGHEQHCRSASDGFR